jgi:hypothetical protein
LFQFSFEELRRVIISLTAMRTIQVAVAGLAVQLGTVINEDSGEVLGKFFNL